MPPLDTLVTAIPARLDRLPWSPWHWRVVIALGVSWLLDGLEVTVVGSLGPALQRPDTLGLTAGEIGWAASAYIGGAVLGALFFGPLADSPRRNVHPLQRELAGFWAARRGPYRVIYEIDEDRRVVGVVRIDHRADVYRPR